MKARHFDFNERKFKELILYIADRCEYDPDFGAIKLNKILYYSDMISYAKYGQPITNAEYIALERGPVPKKLKPVRDEMEAHEEIIVRKKDRFGMTQVRVVPRRSPDLSLFSAEEISLVDRILEVLAGVTATSLSEFTHLERGWQAASYRETIPYETVFLSTDGATESDKLRAEELVRKYEW